LPEEGFEFINMPLFYIGNCPVFQAGLIIAALRDGIHLEGFFLTKR